MKDISRLNLCVVQDRISRACVKLIAGAMIAARVLATYLIPGCVGRGVRLGSENSSGAGGVWGPPTWGPPHLAHAGPKWVGPCGAQMGGPTRGPSGWAMWGPSGWAHMGPKWVGPRGAQVGGPKLGPSGAQGGPKPKFWDPTNPKNKNSQN